MAAWVGVDADVVGADVGGNGVGDGARADGAEGVGADRAGFGRNLGKRVFLGEESFHNGRLRPDLLGGATVVANEGMDGMVLIFPTLGGVDRNDVIQ